MSEAWIFLKGLAVGLAIAAPFGPIGILCIRRTLTQGRLAGFVSGLGAALADTSYGAVAALGLTVISGFLLSNQFWLRLGGGALLCVIGLRTMQEEPQAPRGVGDPSSLLGDFGSTFALTLTNPMTILSFAAVFAAAGISGDSAFSLHNAVLLAGVFLGSTGWFTLLTVGAGAARGSFTENHFRWTNRIAGLIIAVFGVLAMASIAVMDP